MANRFVGFFESVGKEFAKLFGKSSTFEQTAVSTIKYIAPLVETILTLTAGGPASEVATKIINAIESDLTTVSAVVKGAQAAPGSTAAVTVQTALTSVQSNLSEILTDADIKNSAKITEITTTVNLIRGEIGALLSGLSTAPPAAPAAPVAAA